MARHPIDAQTSTVAQLKQDIDSGRTGDKVSAPDPGLSSLGTDDEAAGTPNSPERIALARRQEAQPVLAASDATSKQASRWMSIGIMVIVVLAIVLGAVWVALRS
ncbi:hypothetical protein [Lichenihabitans psoromatis]|uniref:hypothetical protein n=1 Tax=Lichenihabitans psoromatis TaxID=2528642 RepID=UPI001036D0B6|nr:hypothetical protein [Lichenihabitans psoromatis]